MKEIEKALTSLLEHAVYCGWQSDNDVKLVDDARTELAELKQNLKGIEWASLRKTDADHMDFPDGWAWSCPACGFAKSRGHKPNCWLAKIVREA